MEKRFYRGGAPKKAEEDKRTRFVQVKFRQDEFERMEQRRAGTMARDISSFVRAVCLEKPLPIKAKLETYQDEALSLLQEIRQDVLRIGININQSSRRVNNTTDYHDMQRDYQKMRNELDQLTGQIRQLMTAISPNIRL